MNIVGISQTYVRVNRKNNIYRRAVFLPPPPPASDNKLQIPSLAHIRTKILDSVSLFLSPWCKTSINRGCEARKRTSVLLLVITSSRRTSTANDCDTGSSIASLISSLCVIIICLTLIFNILRIIKRVSQNGIFEYFCASRVVLPPHERW